jgi:hypothetical protein
MLPTTWWLHTLTEPSETKTTTIEISENLFLNMDKSDMLPLTPPEKHYRGISKIMQLLRFAKITRFAGPACEPAGKRTRLDSFRRLYKCMDKESAVPP